MEAGALTWTLKSTLSFGSSVSVLLFEAAFAVSTWPLRLTVHPALDEKTTAGVPGDVNCVGIVTVTQAIFSLLVLVFVVLKVKVLVLSVETDVGLIVKVHWFPSVNVVCARRSPSAVTCFAIR